jgi:hypothetical protein
MKNAHPHGRPWQSRLIPYEEEILELRRRRPPMPFEQIAARLATRYGVKVHLDTVHNFVKVRSGLYRENSRKLRSVRAAVTPPPPSSAPEPEKSGWDSLSEARVLIPNSKKGTS